MASKPLIAIENFSALLLILMPRSVYLILGLIQRHKGMETIEALRIIEGCSKEYDFKARKGALIWRSEHFANDMAKRIGLIQNLNDYRKENGGVKSFFTDLAEYGDRYYLKSVPYGIAFSLWSEFCNHWDISWHWSGIEENLHTSIKDTPEINDFRFSEEDESSEGFQAAIDMECSVVHALNTEFDEGQLYLHPRGLGRIEIKIKADTTRESILEAWPRIEKIQKEIYKKKLEGISDFDRNICWFDLSKKCGLSIKEIADLWIKYKDKDSKRLALRNFKREARKDLKASLPGRTNILKDDDALLKEIEEGALKTEFLDDFKSHMDYYLKGLAHIGYSSIHCARMRKYRPKFYDLIKAAIKRIDSYITHI